MTKESTHWARQLTPYHWFVFLIATASWFFDCLDQRLFSLARNPALKELMPTGDVQAMGKDVTAMFLVGWGVGGLIFGPLGDRFGRAKMLTLTVLIYSLCTGLTYFSRFYWDFALFRFLTGVGVGGVFGLAVALIAETLPDGARAGALGWLQILSTVGNLSAGVVKIVIDRLVESGAIEAGSHWRWMFLVGAIPALLVVFIMKYLKEPEPWLKAKAEGRLPKGSVIGPYLELLSDRRWRRNLAIGALISATGVVGLWAIGEYMTDLQAKVFRIHFEQQNVPADEVQGMVENARSYAYLLQMVGAAVGMWLMTKACIVLGRKPAFAIWFAAAFVVTLYVYWTLSTPQQAYWMMPLMWAFQLGVFAGFAIYLPEIFPSRMRSTGTSFCYNLGRFAAAGGSYFSAKLATDVFQSDVPGLQERYAAMAMCAIFLVGLFTLPFAPETKNQPLPE
ncbi:MAG: MFS transporter [Pirellulales bacterium]